MATQVQRREQIATEKVNSWLGRNFTWIGGRLKRWDAEEGSERLEHKTRLETSDSGWVIHPRNLLDHKHWAFSVWRGFEDSLEEEFLYMIYVSKEKVYKFIDYARIKSDKRVATGKPNQGVNISQAELLRLFNDEDLVLIYDPKHVAVA